MSKAPIKEGKSLPASGTTILEPDPTGILRAIQKIGYTVHQALADIVDNSIDAQAENVLIAFVRTNKKLTTLLVVDDGLGITPRRIDRAMGFGKVLKTSGTELGKYGLGLKAAAFSQADCLTVASRSAPGKAVGRRWTAAGVEKGWRCDKFSRPTARKVLDYPYIDVDLAQHGTVIQLDELDEFRVAASHIKGKTQELFSDISQHLGLHFHRFLENGLSIRLAVLNNDKNEWGPPQEVIPLDPFGGPTGSPGFPKRQTLRMEGLGTLKATYHILQKNSRHSSYRLGGGQVANRQGFYFYRNDRLIQAGGWCGLRNDSEPHMSLARVSIDIPSRLDSQFHLDVQKSSVDPPPGFRNTIREKPTFQTFVKRAEEVYRTATQEARRQVVPVPGKGAPKKAGQAVKKRLRTEHVDLDPIAFEWRSIRAKRLFELDRDQGRILLNERYQKRLAHSQRALGVVLSLIAFEFGDDLRMTRLSKDRAALLDKQARALADILD